MKNNHDAAGFYIPVWLNKEIVALFLLYTQDFIDSPFIVSISVFVSDPYMQLLSAVLRWDGMASHVYCS